MIVNTFSFSKQQAALSDTCNKTRCKNFNLGILHVILTSCTLVLPFTGYVSEIWALDCRTYCKRRQYNDTPCLIW